MDPPLVDADAASNPANWQWVAGSGADAAPYFRVFNPVLQGEKFDAEGEYVRRWVPELARLPAPLIHQPWKATPLELKSAGIALGLTYPEPIIDHRAGRERALAAYAKLRAALIPTQGTDGSSFDFPGSFYSYTYATSFAVMALELGLKYPDEPRR